jgi:hypothetical protein
VDQLDHCPGAPPATSTTPLLHRPHTRTTTLALALHWAHRVAGHFPDGPLYINLHGFDPTGTITTPAEVIRGFLGRPWIQCASRRRPHVRQISRPVNR